MSLIIPQSQAIRFVPEGETPFNEAGGCGCGDEKYFYPVFPDDTICFQARAECTEGDDFILNGSFEEGSGEEITDWVIVNDDTENTKVERLPSNANCGSYSATWTNAAPNTPTTASLTQDYPTGFTIGMKYVLRFSAKIDTGLTSFPVTGDILKITIGGVVFMITPTDTYEEYEIVVIGSSAMFDTNIVFEMNTGSSTNVLFMYVDCISMREVETCCNINIINNSDFEDGQRAGDGVNEATFDMWVQSDLTLITESLTGGIDGSRCVEFLNSGTPASLTQSGMFEAGKTYVLRFWAYDTGSGNPFSVATDLQTIFSEVLTTSFQQYEVQFTVGADLDLSFVADNQNVFLDDVSLVEVLSTFATIVDLSNEEIISIDSSNIESYAGVVNVCIPVNEYNLPECFKICFMSCIDDMVLNGDFAEGSGNVFTSWAQTQPSRTNILLRSQEFDNASWTKSNTTISANATAAPDGTTTADRIDLGAGTLGKLVAQTVANGSNVAVTTHVFAKYNAGNPHRYIQIQIDSTSSGCNFDLLTGAMGVPQNCTAQILPSANGFYHISITQTSIRRTPIIWAVDSLVAALTSSTSSTGSYYLWGFQEELGSVMTPYIPTTTAASTVSTGEILQDPTGGIAGSRAALLWYSGAGNGIQQTISLAANTGYILSLWAKISDAVFYQGGVPILKVQLDGVIKTGGTLTSSYQEFIFPFTTDGTPDNLLRIYNEASNSFGFMAIDNVSLYSSETQVCSEPFKFTEQADECFKEVIWYDNSESTDVFGIDYTTGFKNKFRAKAGLLNATYIKDLSKTLNGTESQINKFDLKKEWDFTFESLPEFMWDRVAIMAGVSNIEFGGVELCSNENSEPTIQWVLNPPARLASGSIKVSPKGEYLAQRGKNC